MGWLYTETTPLPRQEIETYIRDRGWSSEILASALVGSTVYMAMRHTCPADHPATPGKSYVFAAVILTSNTAKDGFGYKAMDESWGPNEANCPARILNMLSPLEELHGEHEHARAWRERCRENLAAKGKLRKQKAELTPGTRIKTAKPLLYDGVPFSTFEVHPSSGQHWGRRKRALGVVFTPVRDDGSKAGFLCRVRADDLKTATII